MPEPVDDLERFVTAQSPIWRQVIAQLAAGRKTTHWMWFVFPQLKELGRSHTAVFYGLTSGENASAYGQHPVLGARLRECAQTLLEVKDRTTHEIFGSPDDLKLRSSMTLFAQSFPEEPLFDAVLARYYDGERDDRTLALLAGATRP